MTLKSNTPAEHKDCWRTPYAVFAALNAEFNFTLDVAASQTNSLCTDFFTEADDALSHDWVSDGAIFCNPPYSNIRPWVDKAAEQSRKQNRTVVMLVPEDMSVGWFSAALATVDEVRVITDGRVNFVNPATGIEQKGNSKGSMLLISRPFIRPRQLITTVSKRWMETLSDSANRGVA